MAFLVTIGTSIVGKITEYTVSPVIRQVGYVISYNKNVKKLRSRVSDLVNARDAVKHKIEAEERNNKRVGEDVKSWLTGVDEITVKANAFLRDEKHAEVKCLHGFCPNLKLRHQLSRKSTKLALDVGELYAKKDFTIFSYEVPLQEMCMIANPDYEAFDSRTSTVKAIMDELKKSGTYMIGVYGIGGVGKTTLVKELYRQATTGEKLFDEVVMVLDLKQNPSIRRIQKEIAEKLGLELSETDTDAGRARRVCNRIKDKKTLVLLDDVWESIDLEAVGVPRMATLKILLTSRSGLVLSSEMGTQKDFHLDVLDKEESWILFQKEVGDVVKDPEIGTVATQVAEKCGGLPLLIVTVARSLKDSPLHDWSDTFRRLQRLDGQGLTKKTYSAIEWSYNKLEGEELKSLFLLCGVSLWDDYTYVILDLMKYSMGLGFLKDVSSMKEAQDSLNSLIRKLQNSCLLLDNVNKRRIRMHDLVKDVAKDIAFRDQHVLSRSHGSELKEWPDNEFCQKCSMISLRDCNIPQFPEVLQCRELKLFLLGGTIQSSFQEVPDNFFREMKKLRVLDLTALSMPSLPSSLQFLISLRTLCLDLCTLGDLSLVGELRNLEILSLALSKFKQLPKEIGQLTRLRLLDLSGCTELEVISPNVLSSFKRLEQLRMGDSFNKWESEGGIDTERRNANLGELKHLTQLTTLQIHIPDANILPPNLFTNHKLQRYQVCIGSAWKWTDVDENLNTLKLQLTVSNELDQGLIMLLKSTEDLYLEEIEGVNTSILSRVGFQGIQHLKHLHVKNHIDVAYMMNGKIVFPNLTWLALSELNDSKFMLSSSMARSLVQLERLQISNCGSMEHIISLEESDEESIGIMFSKLQDLELKDLPNLLKFYSWNDTKVQTPPIGRLEVEVCTESDIICEEIAETDSKENTHTELARLTNLYPEMHASYWPLLNDLRVIKCEKVNIFGMEISSFQEDCEPEHLCNLIQQSLFIIDKDSFPNLERLVFEAKEFWNGPFPAGLFSKLKHLDMTCLASTSVTFLDRPLIVNHVETIFGTSTTSTAAGGLMTQQQQQYLHLRELRLIRMQKLMHLGYKQDDEDNSQSAPNCPNIPNLEILFVNGCDSLRNLRSSAISFKYLTTLKVTCCDEMEYLVTHSMARDLMHLTKLKVKRCPRLVTIVGSSQATNSGSEIAFRQLKHMKLSSLPRLQGFCLENCMVKLPPLETLSMSNRLKLKLFPRDETLQVTEEEEDTDVEESETLLTISPQLQSVASAS